MKLVFRDIIRDICNVVLFNSEIDKRIDKNWIDNDNFISLAIKLDDIALKKFKENLGQFDRTIKRVPSVFASGRT